MRRPQFRGDGDVAENPGDTRQRLQMIGAGKFRRHKHQHEIDGFAVNGFEIDRLFESRENPEYALAFLELGVW